MNHKHMEQALRLAVEKFFRDEFAKLLVKKLKEKHKLTGFKVHPFALVALSSGILGSPTSENMAKALLYPRVFGTSFSTTFGDRMQKLCTSYLGARASAIPGMDIEFEDKIDGKQVIMQMKAGPNTLNHDDVAPILAKMNSAYRLLVQNRAGTNIPTFAIGIAYGRLEEISGHYKAIAASWISAQQMNVPIYIGQDLWHRITGDPNFYTDMVRIFVHLFEKEDYSELLEEDLKSLSHEIETKYFTSGKFDVGKV